MSLLSLRQAVRSSRIKTLLQPCEVSLTSSSYNSENLYRTSTMLVETPAELEPPGCTILRLVMVVAIMARRSVRKASTLIVPMAS